jgi:nucleoside-diphosphate-sugar epimerase
MNLWNERFFLTGATGFVGACLARKLAELGCEVHALVRPAADRWRLKGVGDCIRFHEADITDEEALRKTVSRIQPTVIYHLAVHGAYPQQTNADETIRTNVFGAWSLLKACAELDYKVFVNTGSSSEYGSKHFAMRETDLLEPASYYAVAKCAQTLVCEHMARADRRPINTFRLFSVYGPYEAPTRLIPTVLRRCLLGESLDLVAPDTARDFIYVDDVVEAYLQLGQLSLQCGEVFNIGTGVQSTVRDVVNAALHATGADVQVNWGSLPARPWDTSTWVADCSKVRRKPVSLRVSSRPPSGCGRTSRSTRTKSEGAGRTHRPHCSPLRCRRPVRTGLQSFSVSLPRPRAGRARS